MRGQFGVIWKLKHVFTFLLFRGLFIIFPLSLILLLSVENNGSLFYDFVLIIDGVFVSWFILEILHILSKPVITWKLLYVNGRSAKRGQLLLNIQIKRNAFWNFLLGNSGLSRLRAHVIIADKQSSCRWTNKPEPTIDGRNIPDNLYTSLSSGESDNLLLLWVDNLTGQTYIADEWGYHSLREEDEIFLPNDIYIKLINGEDEYSLTIDGYITGGLATYINQADIPK